MPQEPSPQARTPSAAPSQPPATRQPSTSTAAASVAAVVLAVDDAHKRFGSTAALQGASFVLRHGEWLGLLGPNGAGKTTLIRAVVGRVPLDHGRIDVLGTEVRADAAATAMATGSAGAGAAAHAALRGRLGLVPQEIALWPLLTARENLRAFAELHGVPAAEVRERVAWALHFTGLEDRVHALVQTFSGGMKRRLNIACGVLHRPEIVLLDEPTVGVDPQSRQRIWDMLQDLRRDGASLLQTTHQLDEAEKLCQRVVVIDHGRTIADGPPDELVAATVGRGRRVTLLLDAPWTPVALADVAELAEAPCAGEAGWVPTGRALQRTVDDVAASLPRVLERVQAAGRRVEDVRIDAPTLHDVFLRLTGRELRQ